jgi:phospholipase C
VDDLGLGVRVQLLTISPYTERGVIDTEVGEFSTPLRFIADNWGLPYLTPRIEKTHSFEHVFNFKKPPRDPVFGRKVAPTYGTPWEFPEGYDGWEPGTVPNEDHFV